MPQFFIIDLDTKQPLPGVFSWVEVNRQIIRILAVQHRRKLAPKAVVS